MTASRIADKYEVVGQLGRGGMGVVYQVRHLTLQTVLALKILPPELAENPELVARFYQEARLMAQLQHPNIVRVLDVDRAGNSHYFIMEYIAGRSLNQYLRAQGPLALPEVLEIARQVASALAYAHRHEPPVIHRDIKPDNILLEAHSGRAVVTDFGIAKVLGAAGQTSTGSVLGTLLYCAPEQILRSHELDGRADLYSLGLVMYEMVTGRSFFAGLDERALLGRVLHGPDENIPTFAGSTPPEFVALVTRVIARDPAQRYQQAADLLRDIEQCLDLLAPDTPTRHIPEVEADASPPSQAEKFSASLRMDKREPRPASARSLMPRLALSLCIICFAAVFSYGLAQHRRMPVAPAPYSVTPSSSAPGLGTRTVNDVDTSIFANPIEEKGRSGAPESSHPTEHPMSPPRRYRVTTLTAVRAQPNWKGAEIARLKPSTKIRVVALAGEWLKVESRSTPPKPPGYVWKEDAKPE